MELEDRDNYLAQGNEENGEAEFSLSAHTDLFLLEKLSDLRNGGRCYSLPGSQTPDNIFFSGVG